MVAGDVHFERDAVGPVRGDLNGRGEGVIGVRSGSDVIRLFPDALRVLQEFWDGEHDPTKLAVASSADTPFAAAIAQAALDILEIVPGVTLREVLCRGHPEGMMDHIRIGRTPPLSSDKSKTHFPLIREATGIDYDGMLFFDDSNWSYLPPHHRRGTARASWRSGRRGASSTPSLRMG